MTSLVQLFVVIVILLTGIALVATFNSRHHVRLLVIITWAATVAAIAFGGVDQLGRPKPIAFEHGVELAGNATVLGAAAKEGEAIWLTLQADSWPEPRLFTLPWDQRLAQQLQQAQAEAEANGTGVQASMQGLFEPSLDDGEPVFHAPPQEALPPKQPPQDQPLEYHPPAEEPQP